MGDAENGDLVNISDDDEIANGTFDVIAKCIMKKRFKTFIFALAAVLLIPTSAFASTGDTDASDSDTGDTNVGDIVIYGAGDWDTILSADYEVSKSVTIFNINQK